MRKMEYIGSFINVVREGSFARAADKLNLTSAAVGKQIKVLEENLGYQLIHRLSSGISLTEAGEVFYQHALQISDACSQAESALQNMSGVPKGLLYMAANNVFGTRVISPVLPEFLERYPEIKIKFHVTDLFPNLERNNIDVLFDFTITNDAKLLNCVDLACKHIGDTCLVYCASPDYLTRAGTPKQPNELLQHRYITHSSRDPDYIVHFKDDLQLTLDPFLRVDCSHAMAELARAGVGIALIEKQEIVEMLERGELIEVLSEYNNYQFSLGAYYRKTVHPIPKIRAIIDFMIEKYNKPLS